MDLTINTEHHYNYTLLELEGSLNTFTAPLLQQAIQTAIEEGGQHLLLECSHLVNINGDGLKVLLFSHQNLPRFHEISMCNVSTPITALLELSGITRFITLSQDLHDAEILMMESDIEMGRLGY